MADFPMTTALVSPTENDVHGSNSVGTGAILFEGVFPVNLKAMLGGLGFVQSGYTMPATGAGLTSKNITAGTAVVDGYLVANPSATSVNFTASLLNYVYLKLVYGSGIVASAQIEVNTTGTAPASSTLLGTVTCNTTGITATVDGRPNRTAIWGTLKSDGTIFDYGSGGWTAAGSNTFVVNITSGYFLRMPIVSACFFGAVPRIINVGTASTANQIIFEFLDPSTLVGTVGGLGSGNRLMFNARL